ncbi:hypothetical protein GCM10010873_23290 [Cypionkella aquatica]|uniref:DUF1223 domain-containing protein n=1 Tax=Cypionkella aquatica TaxID=1756042 RepID=A0AA37U4W6_9RHOB|nr:DUF1223 domain-containing protein [Cypionkella aquatica]GLS87355.1 hypothetical protein GCM10010873_23290 [Cypionkella aquatica]
MMQQIFSGLGALAVSAAVMLPVQALAESEQGVLVELYTSQGCSSCPPADELMAKLATMPGVIGLTLHVDYWDYIGWTDTFGKAQFTERQKAYAHASGEKMIYTPQMIVAGGARVAGNQPDQVAAALAAVPPSQVALTLARQGGDLVIKASSAQALAKDVTVQLVHYTDKAMVEIDRGENAGMKVAYHNIVTAWQKVGSWSGAAPLDLVTPAGEGPVVVLLQAGPWPGQVIAAARLK